MNRFSCIKAVWAASALALILSTGCCQPLLFSHRIAASPTGESQVLCGCDSGWEHALLHARSSHPPIPGGDPVGKGIVAADGPPLIQPPPAKFHPVPTRPVFAPQAAGDSH